MSMIDHQQDSRNNTVDHMAVALRMVIAFCIALLVAYLSLQSDHARAKGTAMDSWRLIPMLLTAATAAFIGKRFLNSISGLFLGGIGGSIGTLDQFSGPYGGVVGLLVGAIVVILPILHKPKIPGNGNKELTSPTQNAT